MKINREKYEELRRGKSVPYCFEIKKGRQRLFYFGANHSHDPKNKQYPVLRAFWKKFLKTHSTEKLVVVEGSLRRAEKTEKAAVEHGSEGSIVTIWTRKSDIPIICPEPLGLKINKAIKKKFTKDEIYYLDFAHYADAWYRYNPQPDFTEYMTRTMAVSSRQFKRTDFTLPRMKAVHKKIFKKNFSLKDPKFFNRITNPNRTDTIVNRVAGMTSDIRDEAILKRIQKEWREGKSLFITYGSGHAFLHEPILRKILK
jgi:hypothetical protein